MQKLTFKFRGEEYVFTDLSHRKRVRKLDVSTGKCFDVNTQAAFKLGEEAVEIYTKLLSHSFQSVDDQSKQPPLSSWIARICRNGWMAVSRCGDDLSSDWTRWDCRKLPFAARDLDIVAFAELDIDEPVGEEQLNGAARIVDFEFLVEDWSVLEGRE